MAVIMLTMDKERKKRELTQSSINKKVLRPVIIRIIVLLI
jgi:hypothetical protein